MKNYRLSRSSTWILLVCLFIPMISFSQSVLTIKDLSGSWSGALKIQGKKLRLVMNINYNEADSLIVSFDSPDQGVLDLPTDKTVLEENSIYVSAGGIGGEFSGKVNKGVDTINGAWKQGGMAFPVVLVREGQRTTMNRPQEPKPPYPYRSLEVTIPNTAGGFDLAGTLTLPEAKGKYPVAILITGSGPQNRDEELLGHKPFLVLADYLTRQGFAVLRYDDRGVGKSKGDSKTATTFDFASDAEAAITFLKGYPEIDTTRMGLIGHSEGGIIAPIVATGRKDVAFIVLLAGPGITGEQILLLQSALISKSSGVDEASIKVNEKFSRDIYSVLKKNKENDKAEQKLRALFADLEKRFAKDTSYHPTPQNEITAQIGTLTTPWFRCFLTLDPEVYLSKVTCPVLALNGSLDLQVPAKENLEAIEKALIFGGNSSYVVEELPGLNHLFQTAKTGNPSEYVKIEETISPVALEFVGGWMKKIVGR
ncbi:MAG: alpha/beta hydrolase family protein [Bacteroidales bacterium]